MGKKKNSDKLQSVIITATLLVNAGNISSLEGHSNNCCLTVSWVLLWSRQAGILAHKLLSLICANSVIFQGAL